jgi:hypothetical protein
MSLHCFLSATDWQSPSDKTTSSSLNLLFMTSADNKTPTSNKLEGYWNKKSPKIKKKLRLLKSKSFVVSNNLLTKTFWIVKYITNKVCLINRLWLWWHLLHFYRLRKTKKIFYNLTQYIFLLIQTIKFVVCKAVEFDFLNGFPISLIYV